MYIERGRVMQRTPIETLGTEEDNIQNTSPTSLEELEQSC